jgi:hypothetical protein
LQNFAQHLVRVLVVFEEDIEEPLGLGFEYPVLVDRTDAIERRWLLVLLEVPLPLSFAQLMRPLEQLVFVVMSHDSRSPHRGSIAQAHTPRDDSRSSRIADGPATTRPPS